MSGLATAALLICVETAPVKPFRVQCLTFQGVFHVRVDEVLHVTSFAHKTPRTLERFTQLHVQLQPDLLSIHGLCVQLWQQAFPRVQCICHSSRIQRLHDIITVIGPTIILQLPALSLAV